MRTSRKGKFISPARFLILVPHNIGVFIPGIERARQRTLKSNCDIAVAAGDCVPAETGIIKQP